MPVTIDVYDFKFWNQLRNGENFDQNLGEFTPNLVGNVGEKIKVEFKANLAKSTAAENGAEWQITNTVDIKEIVRSSGSFLEDGIRVGDRYNYFDNWENRKTAAAAGVYTADVTYISNDGKVLKYSFIAGAQPATGIYDNVGFVVNQLVVNNISDALFLKFGLIGNDESFNALSKVTESEQVYYRGGIPVGDPPVLGSAESLGVIKDWVSGAVAVGLSNVDPDFNAAQYTVSHEFIVNPFYTLALREFIDSGETPELFAGANAVKYALELELRKTLSDTGSSASSVFDLLDGFVGWYGENFNGLNTKYQIASVSYEEAITADPLDGININASTLATIVVENVDGAISDFSCSVYLVKLPSDEDEYIGTNSTLLENFLYKSEIVSSPATSTTNVTTSIVDGDLIIEYTVDFSLAEKLKLSTEDEYMLMVQIEDPTVAAGNSDRVMLLADLRNYVDVDFIGSFVDVLQYRFFQIGQDEFTGGTSSPIVSNEDGILLDAIFGVDITKNVQINAVDVKLLAYNQTTNKSFQLDSYSFNLGGLIFSGGVQQINIDGVRGYPLPVGDIFNVASITTEDQLGDFRYYQLKIGQKIKWQEWLLNADVDNVFFDPSEPNNNLNDKTSNYSGLEGYEIKLALQLNVSGVDDLGRTLTGEYVNFGSDVQVNDYDQSVDGVTGAIDTFDVETGNPLQGNILYNGKDTLFRAVFQNASLMDVALHRIEPSQNQGDGILEISNFSDPETTNLLKPLAGEDRLKFTKVLDTLTTECLIDGSKIQEGVSYKLSARTSISEPPFNFGNWKVRFDGVNDFADHNLLAERTGDASLTWWFWLNVNDELVNSRDLFEHSDGSAVVQRRLRTVNASPTDVAFNSFPPVAGSQNAPFPYAQNERMLIMLNYSTTVWRLYVRSPSLPTGFNYVAALASNPINLKNLKIGELSSDILEAGIVYDAAQLTNVQIDELYNGGNGIDILDHSSYGNLEKSHWKIDEGSGLILADSGDTNYDLNLNNFTGTFWIPV